MGPFWWATGFDRFCSENDLLPVFSKGHLYRTTERSHHNQTRPQTLSSKFTHLSLYLLIFLHYLIMPNESNSSIQWFHFFNGIFLGQWHPEFFLVSRNSSQEHGSKKVHPSDEHQAVSMEISFMKCRIFAYCQGGKPINILPDSTGPHARMLELPCW